MRRLLLGLLLPALLTGALLLPAATAWAAPAPRAASIVLATEAGGDLPGPTPRGANDEDNAFAPDQYEANFLWGAGVGLLALILGAVAGIGGLYWLLVLRPGKASAA